MTTAKAGVIYLLIAGESVQVTVKDGDTRDAIVDAMVAKINANTNLPVTAAKIGDSAAESCELTCKWKGITGNDIDVRVNYYDGEVLPSGVTLTISQWPQVQVRQTWRTLSLRSLTNGTTTSACRLTTRPALTLCVMS